MLENPTSAAAAAADPAAVVKRYAPPNQRYSLILPLRLSIENKKLKKKQMVFKKKIYFFRKY